MWRFGFLKEVNRQDRFAAHTRTALVTISAIPTLSSRFPCERIDLIRGKTIKSTLEEEPNTTVTGDITINPWYATCVHIEST